MSIAFRSASTTANGAAPTSITVTRPSGTVDGDLMVAFVVISADQTITAGPGSWTELTDQATGAATGDSRHTVWWKVAAGETGDYTWTFSAGADAAAAILTYSGASQTVPIQTSASNLMVGSTLDHTAPSVTPSSASTYTIFAIGVNPVYDGNTTFTTPAGLTARAEADPGAGTTNRAVLKVFDASTPTAAATGSKTTTLNNHAKGVGHSVVLAPLVAAAQSILLDSRAV